MIILLIRKLRVWKVGVSRWVWGGLGGTFRGRLPSVLVCAADRHVVHMPFPRSAGSGAPCVCGRWRCEFLRVAWTEARGGAAGGGGVLPRPRFPAPSAAAAVDPEMGPAPGRAHIPTWPPGSPARAPVCAAGGGLQCKDAGSPQVRVPCWASCWASRWGRSACFRGGPGCTTDAVPADTSGKLGGAGRTQARATRGLWVRPPPPGGVWLCAPRRLALPPRGPRSRRGLRLAFPLAPRTRSVPLTGARSGDKAVALSGLRGVSDYGVVLPQKARVTGFDSESNSGWKSVTACGKQNQTRLTFLPALQRVCFVW